MNLLNRFTLTFLLVALQMLSPLAMAADTSIAGLNISGNSPVVFDVSARGYPGDLDLGGNGIVATSRLLGTFHFKYNVGIASLTLKSAEVDGVPSSATATGNGYKFGTAFKLIFGTCTTIAATYKAVWAPVVGTPAVDLGAGIDIKDAATTSTAALNTAGAGREEDCDLSATWGGAAASLPLAGKYTLTLTLTMVSI